MEVGGRTTNTSDASAGVRSGSRTRASASATVVSGAEHHRLGGHQAARGVRRVAQQPPHGFGVLGIHPAQEQLGIGGRHRAEQVGGVVGIHRLEHVGGAFGVQLPQHVGLLFLGQLLQHVGEPFVVEGVDHLEATLVCGSSRIASATSIGRWPSNCSSSCATPWPGIASPDGVKPCTCCQSTM